MIQQEDLTRTIHISPPQNERKDLSIAIKSYITICQAVQLVSPINKCLRYMSKSSQILHIVFLLCYLSASVPDYCWNNLQIWICSTFMNDNVINVVLWAYMPQYKVQMHTILEYQHWLYVFTSKHTGQFWCMDFSTQGCPFWRAMV